MAQKKRTRIVVRTPDRREFRGYLLEIEVRSEGRRFAVVELDSGWVTSYPESMVHQEPEPC